MNEKEQELKEFNEAIQSTYRRKLSRIERIWVDWLIDSAVVILLCVGIVGLLSLV